ncbi:ubiquitin-like modifier-activating enzyme 6 [Saccostrea cucullata]|uniref:ubiquitin-like modifier-activating enzyme 6 n=1 Tax=Saccostrea cuccullata TaxID=36930 RepID=UPI002ED0FDF1
MDQGVEIDDSLYSRQRYVLGDSAMKQMANSSILIYGMGGLGIEIAKNIVLAGVKNITIQDGRSAVIQDLGTQFFLREGDIGRNRAESSGPRLSELNPYVSLTALTTILEVGSDLNYLKKFQCVILTEAPLSVQIRVNNFCRQQIPPIRFISADVFGVCCGTFCDFGDRFEIMDIDGEDPKEVLIEKITKDNPGIVTCFNNKMHGFESGDHVTFREINGMTALNGYTCQIKVTSPYTFEICDTSGQDFAPYEHGGIVKQVKVSKMISFKSLEQELRNPSLLVPDLCKFEAPTNLHLGFLALHQFYETFKRFPNVWNMEDANNIISIATSLNTQLVNQVADIDEYVLRVLSYTCHGCLAPLCAALGGFVAQEGIKAVTGKFTPLRQWLYLDCREVVPKEDAGASDIFTPRNDRYDAQRICLGQRKCDMLAQLKLFMVGCGAIGCEMLKNYALLGIGRKQQGCITITDNDLIEKSNLNRQFLFRPADIQKPKSTTAAGAVLNINADLNIEAQQHKVCPQTEDKVYNDAFFENQSLVVNALDNIEARRYVDSRCVTNQRALLESGTLGTKGHVQVIVPHMTESYSSQNDPRDESVPYCTLKSFPVNIEHCIQWARDKFESSFTGKPDLFNKFWKQNGEVTSVIQKLKDGQSVDGAVQVSKMVANRSATWCQCVQLARLKFQKYFNHKAKHLLHMFPLDTKMQDGSLFWQSPKRPPVPQEFDIHNPLHLLFIVSTARLYAGMFNIPVSSVDTSFETINSILQNMKIPEYRPTNKKIVTDESASKPMEATGSGDDLLDAANRLQSTLSGADITQVLSPMNPAEFEKDDDTNGHIDFIAAASNLRGAMYKIDSIDRLKAKRIAGRIVPAIATTTATVSGLVTVELIKVMENLPLEVYKNAFLNLALPIIVLSEPGPAEKTVIKEGLTVTMWDRWEVHGTADFTLQQFLQHFKDKYGFEVTMVSHGVKMVYVPFMPGHKKRLPQQMLKLLKPSPGQLYMDLIINLEGSEDDDIACPPVRYYFGV